MSSFERWQECVTRVQANLLKAGFDALLTCRLEHVRYLTGYQPPFSLSAGHRAACLVTPTSVVVGVPLIDLAGFRSVRAREMDIRSLPLRQEEWAPFIRNAMMAHGVAGGRIAGDQIPAVVAAGLADVGINGLTSCSQPLDDAKLAKSEQELETVRRGVRICSAGMHAAMDAVREGISELDVAAEAEYRMRKAGAEGFAFSSIVTGQEWGSRRYATAYQLQRGDFVFVDLGVVVDAYTAEFSRATVVGEPSRAQIEIYSAAYRANRAVIAAVRPGAKCSELDRLARDEIAGAGLGAYQHRHVTGTGIGILLHERPFIGDQLSGLEDEIIRQGMILNIEPGVYHPELGGARAEDLVVVTSHGAEILTPYPYNPRLILESGTDQRAKGT